MRALWKTRQSAAERPQGDFHPSAARISVARTGPIPCGRRFAASASDPLDASTRRGNSRRLRAKFAGTPAVSPGASATRLTPGRDSGSHDLEAQKERASWSSVTRWSSTSSSLEPVLPVSRARFACRTSSRSTTRAPTTSSSPRSSCSRRARKSAPTSFRARSWTPRASVTWSPTGRSAARRSSRRSPPTRCTCSRRARRARFPSRRLRCATTTTASSRSTA